MSEGVMKNSCSKGQPESRGKAADRAESAAESKDFADFFCSFSGGDSHDLEWFFMMPLW